MKTEKPLQALENLLKQENIGGGFTTMLTKYVKERFYQNLCILAALLLAACQPTETKKEEGSTSSQKEASIKNATDGAEVTLPKTNVSNEKLDKAIALYQKGTEEGYKEAFPIFMELAKGGDQNAQFYLGTSFFEGSGVSKDYKEARKWLEKSSDAGVAQASFNLSLLYESGLGVEADIKQQFFYLNRSRKQGWIKSNCTLAKLYLKGPGVEKNVEEAEYLLQEGILAGYLDCQLLMGFIYLEGLNGKVDHKKAFAIFSDAAKKENADSQMSLSYIYSKGIGVKKNESLAGFWLQKSSTNGNKFAQELLKKMSSSKQ